MVETLVALGVITLLALCSAPPWALGYGAGLVVRAFMWTRAAFEQGYNEGRGHSDEISTV